MITVDKQKDTIHNHEVAGSSPALATKQQTGTYVIIT